MDDAALKELFGRLSLIQLHLNDIRMRLDRIERAQKPPMLGVPIDNEQLPLFGHGTAPEPYDPLGLHPQGGVLIRSLDPMGREYSLCVGEVGAIVVGTPPLTPIEAPR